MPNLSLEKFGKNLPASGLTGLSQASVGLGAGLLIAGCMSSKVRGKLAISLLTLGAVFLLPVLAGIVSRLTNNPNSARRVRRQLETIRHHSGSMGHESELV